MATPQPIILIDILTTTPQYISSGKNDIIDGHEYRKRITNAPQLEQTLTDAKGNQEWPADVSIDIANASGYVTQLNVTQELRGVGIKIRSYNVTTSTALFEYRGFITEKNLGDTATISASVQDILKTNLPLRVLKNDDFASDRTVTAYRPSRDLGKAIPLGIGYVSKSPLLALYEDATNFNYDFLIGYGTIESNNTNKGTTVVVYRNKAVVTNTEYTVYDGSQSSPYAGFAFIRFNPREQRDQSGSPYELYIDYHGLKMGGSVSQRNPIRHIQNLLSNTTWGLSQTVNTASFDTAAAIQIGQTGAVPVLMSDLKADFGLTEETAANDIFSELQSLSRSHLYQNESGEWCVQVDVYNAVDSFTFGDRDTYWKNIFKINPLQYISSHEATKSTKLRYKNNPWENEYAHETSTRTVFAFGEPVILDCPYIRDHATADIHNCYLANKALIADEKLPIIAGWEGSNLSIGQTGAIKIPRASYNIDSRYKIINLSKTPTEQQFDLLLEKHTSAIYEYTPAASLPSDANSDSILDYARTAPAAPSSFAIDSSGTDTTPEGAKSAYVILKANIPTTNASYIMFGYRRNGQTVYTYIKGDLSSGVIWKVTIPALICGLGYDYIAVTYNVYGLPSTSNPVLTNQLAPGDTTPPAVPDIAFITAVADGWHIHVTCAKQTETDFAGFEFHASTTTGFTPSDSTLKQKGNVNACDFFGTLDSQTWYVRICAYDLTYASTGAVTNRSAYSTQKSVTTGVSSVPDGIAPGTPTGLALTTGIATNDDGSQYCWIRATCTANPESDMSYYEFRIKETGGNYIYFYSDTNEQLFRPVRANILHYVGVKAFDKDGNKSAFTDESNPLYRITSASDLTPLAAPSNVTATAGIQYILVTWDAIVSKNLGSYLVYTNTVNSIPANPIADQKDNYFVHGGLNASTDYYYWVKSKNTSGYPSTATQATPAPQTPRNVQTNDVEVIAATKILIDGVVYLTNWRRTGDLTKIDGGQLSTTSILAKTITVQDGTSLDNINAYASNPAARINTQSTTILPGKIQLYGGSNLSSWLQGGDETHMAGGMISSNTVTANKISVGSRNVTFDGMAFTLNKSTNVISWTAGTASYTDTNPVDGQPIITSRSITSGSQSCSTAGTTYYFYWVKDATTISMNTIRGTAFGANNLVLATYVKDTQNLLVFYAKTIIDGSDVTLDTLNGNRIIVDTLDGNRLIINTIAGNKLTINPALRNLVADGGLELGDLSKEYSGYGTTVTLATGSPTEGSTHSGKYSVKMEGNGAGSAIYANKAQYIPVVPGDKYWAEVWIKHTVASKWSYWAIEWTDINKATPTYDAEATAATSWTKAGKAVTVPAGKYFMRLFLQTTGDLLAGQFVYFDDFIVYPQVGTSYIEDLAVTNGKVLNLSCEKLNAGSVRAINIISAIHATKGGCLTSALVGGEATIALNDTTDFPSSGTAYFIDSTNDRDVFTYTGKTSTTLTGCSGVLAHTNGAFVVPAVKSMIIDNHVNEMRFFGNRGDGVIEELASVGLNSYDDEIIKLGGVNNNWSCITAESNFNNPISAAFYDTGHRISDAELCVGGTGIVVRGDSCGIQGIPLSAAGYGGQFYCTVEGLAGGTPAAGPIQLMASALALAPTHSAYKGTLWVTSAGVLYINTNDSTTWAKVGGQ